MIEDRDCFIQVKAEPTAAGVEVTVRHALSDLLFLAAVVVGLCVLFDRRPRRAD